MEKKEGKKNQWAWRITVIAAFSVIIITFSPLVIANEKIDPKLFGMPYALWMGILVTIALVFLTFIATRVHPEGRIAKKNEQQNTRTI